MPAGIKTAHPAESVLAGLVSVIIPAYNAETYIEEALASVLSQTYAHVEVLVVDDGSLDRTAEIVESVAEQDRRVRLLRSSNQGVAAARNLGIEHSVGEYIAPLDADDLWYPSKLEKQVSCFSMAGPEVGLVYAWSAYIDKEGRLTGGYIAHEVEGFAHLSIVYSNFVGNASAPLIRRHCLERVGGYNTQYREHEAQGGEDHDLYVRIAEHYRFGVVREFLVGYRVIEGSLSCNTEAMALSYTLMLAEVRRRHPAVPNRIYRWARSNYYEYLGRKCNFCGDRRGALRWFVKAVSLDPALLAYRRLYLTEFNNLLKLAMRRAPGRMREGVGHSSAANACPQPVGDLSIADIERRRLLRQGTWDALQERRHRYLSALELRGRAE